jgi:hypothetical protein
MQSPMTAYEWFKLTILLPLAAIRFIITMVFLTLALPLLILFLIGGPSTPFTFPPLCQGVQNLAFGQLLILLLMLEGVVVARC